MPLAAAEVDRLASEAVAEARRHIPVAEAFLFGSYVDGTPHEYSDIDLLIVSAAADAWSLAEYLRVNREVRKAVDCAVEPHFVGLKTRQEARPSNFVGYILAHGRRIA